MSRASHESVSDDYFEEMYRRNPDPWRFAASAYERDKYAASLAALGERKFCRGFEVGCSIGIFTQALAARCDHLLAVDVSETAIAHARRRCADLVGVDLQRMRIPRQWPSGTFDLVVLSEVLYYLCAEDVIATARGALRSLRETGLILVVNWTGRTGGPLSGDEAAKIFCCACGSQLSLLGNAQRRNYRLDIFEKARR
jgi:SAM-dependent methyltransferase